MPEPFGQTNLVASINVILHTVKKLVAIIVCAEIKRIIFQGIMNEFFNKIIFDSFKEMMLERMAYDTLSKVT